MLSIWIGALDQGLAYAGLAIGVYLTLRVLNFADITVDGSFALGGGSAALLLSQNVAPPLALLAAVALGALAGAVTGLIHTRLGVNDLFAGILTTTSGSGHVTAARSSRAAFRTRTTGRPATTTGRRREARRAGGRIAGRRWSARGGCTTCERHEYRQQRNRS